MLQIKNKYKIYTAITEYTKLSKKGNKVNKKKVASQILVFLIFFAIIIIAIVIQNNNIHTETNCPEYANLNINQDELNIFYLNVGQGDSTLITINGCNMLIDSGNDQDGYYIVEFLKAQNIEKIDYFILTHFDEDHIGGAYKILEDLEIGVLYMPGNSNKTKTYKKLISTIETEDINVDTTIKASNEVEYSLGNAKWKVLNINDGNDLNDSSIVIEMDYGTTKYLFMGDASTKIEEKIEWNKVDVLKVAHHGSNSSTSQEFLDRVKPKYAIISVGANNSYDLPDKDIIDRLNNNKIKTYRTDKNETIWLTSEGTEIKINSLKYNLDGTGRKQAAIFERKYLYAFFFLH